MLNPTLVKAIASVLFGLLTIVVPVRQAEAAMFVGTFDPLFDSGGLSEFAGLGFRGSATFEVSDTCLSSPGVFCTATPPEINQLISATLTLYDVNRPGIFDQLNFGQSDLINVYTLGGRPFGVNSQILAPASSSLSNPSIYPGFVYLFFEIKDFGPF